MQSTYENHSQICMHGSDHTLLWQLNVTRSNERIRIAFLQNAQLACTFVLFVWRANCLEIYDDHQA